MTKQYSIGGFFIDLSRNQITQNKQSQTLAPKALAVLTYLAENQGQVVSHDALLNEVWPDTVVSPNTLQRSIAQLRKALGDDGKVQVYIKTHAKQGYSLECDVRWHDQIPVSEAHNKTESIDKPQAFRPGIRFISTIAGMFILTTIGYIYLTPKQTSPFTFDRLRSLTATDDKEFDASYTPDGRYTVFHRYLDKQCGNKLWAKNIDTQKEIQLTKEWGTYGRHSFSQDGKQLVFLATEACSQPVTQKNCYNLMSIDFEKALKTPQQPQLILQCQNSIVKSPIWLNTNDIAMLQKKSDRWKLISYSISQNNSTDLYDLKSGNLIDFTYSVKDELIAVTTIHDDGKHYIEMLKPDGRIVSSHQIKYPPEIPKFRSIQPSFDPLNKQLLFSTGRQLFTLSYDGEVTKVSLPFADRMMQPEFHPDGKKILFIKGPYDSDVVLLPLNQMIETSPQLEQPKSYSSFERSTLGEDYAMFQPGGELIAFWSERSGEEQLWVSNINGDGNGPQRLTQFPTDTYIRGIDWAADGQSLLVNANNVLIQVDLNSNQNSFPLEYPVMKLFQWDSKNNSALLQVRINGIAKLVEYDLKSSEIREITEKTVLWALKSKDGRLIYKDHMDQFWQPGPAEAQLIEALDKQGGRSKSFVINGNVIYAINTENFLWSYDLNEDTFKILGKVNEHVDYLTDINQTHLLMTDQIAAKKEVVELSLSE